MQHNFGLWRQPVCGLVMAMLGGAVLPSIQGRIANVACNLRFSFIVPLIAYADVADYGWEGHRVGRTPGMGSFRPPMA
jgi:fucose permease